MIKIEKLARQHEWVDYRITFKDDVVGFSIHPSKEGTKDHLKALSGVVNELWLKRRKKG